MGTIGESFIPYYIAVGSLDERKLGTLWDWVLFVENTMKRYCWRVQVILEGA